MVDLNNSVAYPHYQDYSVTANLGWQSIGFMIQHKTFNWTNFITCSINKGKFEFSHGSGGWNEVSVEDRLKATKDMCDIVTLLYADTERLWEQRIELSKLETIASKAYDTYHAAVKENAIAKATVELEKEHTEVKHIENILDMIKDGGTVKLYSITLNHDNEPIVQENEVENRGHGRANYYFQYYHYAKKDLLSALKTRNSTLKTSP
jgi:hypothetical protein